MMRSQQFTFARKQVLSTFLLAASMSFAANTLAYNYESPVGDGCHERLTMDGLRLLRAELSNGAPLPPAADDQVLIDDLTFSLDDDMRDIAAASLLLGVRDNDLKGRSGIDTEELARVHGDPFTQPEHCLRQPQHDEPNGSEAALQQCRRYILDQFEDAVRFGLDSKGKPDLNKRLKLPITLAFSGAVTPSLPHFYVRMGQALHALQDSFAHTFRTADSRRVTVVLNWVDAVNEQAIESRDGPIHLPKMDHCDDADALLKQRRQVAFEASVALLRAGLADDLNVDQRVAAANAVMFEYLSFEPGCTADNRWCDAPELGYVESSCGCGYAVGNAAVGWHWWSLGLVLMLWWRRARRRRSPRRVISRRLSNPDARWLWSWLPLAVVLRTNDAAAEAKAAAAATTEPAPAPNDADSNELDATTESMTGFGFHASVAAAFDNGAFAFVVAGRYAFDEHWLIGIDAEYNPWFSFDAGRFARGAFNSYATLIYRFPVTEELALRSGAHAGVSVLLFDLVGAPKGSVGPYLGLSLLGLSYRIEEQVYLLLDPADVALPVPQVNGAPLSHSQYRFSIGLQLGG